MNRHFARNALTLSGAVALILATAAAGAESEPARLDSVVVTAQKRVQALGEIPMSVTVVSGDALERQQADNFQDLISLVPGLSINTNTRGVTRISLRGINTGGVASTVGVYANDVPFGSSSGLANGAVLSGDFDTFDMNRIEVLRGPQGTLYGASSLGGVIKYVANEPSTAGFEGRVQASLEDIAGGGMGHALTGVLNMPASDTFAVRASAFYRSDDGFIDSIGINPIPTLQNPAVNIVGGSRVEEDLNGLETYGGRVSALVRPSDAFSLNLTVLFQDIKSDNADRYEADPVTYAPLYGGLIASRYHPEWTDIEYRVYSATMDWDLGGVTLQSVTSYGEFTETFQRDVARVPLFGIPAAQLATLVYSTPGTTDRLLSAIQNQITATDKFTQEFRLLSPENETFEWLVGAYYTEEDSGIDPQIITAVNPGTETPAAGVAPIADGSLPSSYEELALFANATWHITDRFDLSFGGRLSENDQEASQSLAVNLPGVFVGTLVFDGVTSSESPFTWSVSPRFEFSDATSMYARIATGFRPGGPNVLPPGTPPGTPTSYDSDELTSYELGLKTGSADGRFGFDLALFYLDWADIQLFAVVNSVGLNANGGTAVSKGVEFTATARPVDGLQLSLMTAYTDAYLTQDTHPVVGGLDGDPLPWVPEWSFSFGGDYEWGVFGDATAYVGGQVAYTGKRTADFGNRDAGGSIREAGSYTLLDIRTGILWERWSIELYGKNVTDERGINDIAEPGPFPGGAVAIGAIRPRTYGVSFGARF
ncbi:MAG TPA: TonB-dependent receptor [Steroidobacteraceae bacterium]|jgi:outer membrane receptor protein involved in Fe transport